MMRMSAFAIGLAALVGVAAVPTTPVQAQTVEIGPNGPSLDLRSQRQRDRDVAREEMRRDRDYDRRRAERDYDRDLTTGSTRCRTTTIRERDDDGRMVTRETRTCR